MVWSSATTSCAQIWNPLLRLAVQIPADAPARRQSAGNDHTGANQAALNFAIASGILHGINGCIVVSREAKYEPFVE